MLPLNITVYIALGVGIFCGVFGFEVRDWKARSEELQVSRAYEQRIASLQNVIDTKSRDYEAFKVKSEQEHAQDTAAVLEAFKGVKVDPSCATPGAALSVLLGQIARSRTATGSEPSARVRGSK